MLHCNDDFLQLTLEIIIFSTEELQQGKALTSVVGRKITHITVISISISAASVNCLVFLSVAGKFSFILNLFLSTRGAKPKITE